MNLREKRIAELEKLTEARTPQENEYDLSLLSEEERDRHFRCSSILMFYHVRHEKLEKDRKSREAAVKLQGEEVVKQQEQIRLCVSELNVSYYEAERMVMAGEYHRTDEEIAELKVKWEAEYLERVREAKAELEELVDKAKRLTAEKRRTSRGRSLAR